jgi:hypothetical protein
MVADFFSRAALYGLSTALIVVFWSISSANAKHDTSTQVPVDPFTDPKDDTSNPLRYIASNALAAFSFSKFFFDSTTQEINFTTRS